MQELNRLYNFWMSYKIKIANKLQQLQQLNEQTTKNVIITFQYSHDYFRTEVIYNLIKILFVARNDLYLMEHYKNTNKNLENVQEALKKIKNYKVKNTIQVDFPICDLINEIEENKLLKGDLAKNLAELLEFYYNVEENLEYEEECEDYGEIN